MSRIGKQAIIIPEHVSIILKENKILISGPYGYLERKLNDLLDIKISDNKLVLIKKEENLISKKQHGLERSLLQNAVTGVNSKFFKTLILEGVGYKFQKINNILFLNIGFTHIIQFEIPENLEIHLESSTKMIISGIDKEKVGFFASQIREKRPPEPYKGKGILYEGEFIKRKIGKTGKSGK